MSIHQAIASNIRQYRTIPKGSFLWLDVPGADDLLDSREVKSIPALLERYGPLNEVIVHLDTPEGDFEDEFHFDVIDLKMPPAVPLKSNGAREARDAVIANFGQKRIEHVESLVEFYAGHLLSRFRKSHQYTGPAPKIRTRWHTKTSWGSRYRITISPGYLYRPESDYFGYTFWEYQHVRQSPLIGCFFSLNRLNHVKALVAHELAHFLQFNSRYAVLPELDYATAHGEGWQYIYSITRADLNRYINN
ncbi:hypothetical protein [Providencia rettgeri]|uniref:hypothetical protein n=1 Tax=Providencia rettgeri TaxID=587 RepID=UPI0013745B7A|nr:hypothetical protein [Providencia rettgeri]BBV14526.1 hypothetical protein BML2531_43920 [Providencia rettgeri]